MSLPHDSAHTHVAGESEYVDDRMPMKNEVHIDVLYSTRAHCKIINIDFSEALKDKGVIAGFTGEDLAHNRWGAIFQDQPIIATGVSEFAGEPIALIVAESFEKAQYAKQKIKVDYEDLPSVMSITDAKGKKSFVAEARKIERGDIQKAFKDSDLIIEDSVKMQGHDHFYLESQATIAYPLEDGQIEIHTSSQHSTESQHVVAHALGLAARDVVVQVKRLGGGFGGKESQAAPFAAMAALVAQKLNRPARLVLTKDDDMIMTGKRNPFEVEFKVAFNKDGNIQALESYLFSDSGAYADLSTAIMERAMLHSDNSYYIPNVKVVGQVCKTNHHPHTAYRGFGGPKGVVTIELIIEKIAHKLNIDPLEVRKINLYNDKNNTTHYGQVIKNNTLNELVSNLEKSVNYQQKRKETEEYNKKSLASGGEFIKGLSLTTVKFGISFTTRFLNQANAMVIIHSDGSIQISTGATEMGQGVNSKISHVVTTELGLPRSQARVMPTRTDKNANTSPTAASAGTDLNGAAAVLATRKIKHRLSELALKLLDIPKEKWARNTAGLGCAPEVEITTPNLDINDPNEGADWESGIADYHGIKFEDSSVYHKSNPKKKIKFSELVLEAYLNRVSLSDYAFYKIPGIEFNKLTGEGNAFLYFTQAAGCSQVLLNRDTGEVKVEAMNIEMDLGRSLNPEVDKGQVAGAFTQGMGWVTTENLVYNDQGLLLTHAPSTYKIPSIQDTPRDFTINLIENNENYASLRGSKAVGEPPLLLSVAVWTAINNALSYLPQYDVNYPKIIIPATSERVLRAMSPEKFVRYDS
jgi:xanthine dehydrogenase large subunit